MPHVPRAICGDCFAEMVPQKNGVMLEGILQDGRSYYKIAADCYKCPQCGHTMYIGFGAPMMSYHSQYDAIAASYQFDFA